MSWKEILDEPLFRRIFVALLHFLWQGAAVAALYAAADAAARRRRAGSMTRYALACAALAVMVALPIWTFASSSTPGLASADANVSPAAPLPNGAGGTATESFSGSIAASRSGLLASLSEWSGRAGALRPFCMAAWLAGVLVLSVRLALGWTLASRLARRGAVPAHSALVDSFERLARRLAVSRPVRLLESAAVEVPTALGVLRPAVLLPLSGLTGLTPRQIEALLAHELAHVRRNDYVVNLLQSAAETLFFYHPAVWWVSGRIRTERENCCDDLAVSVTGDARLYAGALVELEERRATRGVLALAANGGDLLRRVSRLFPGAAAAPNHSRRVAGGLALAALLLAGAALRVSSREGTPVLATPAAAAAPATQIPRNASHASRELRDAAFVRAALPQDHPAEPSAAKMDEGTSAGAEASDTLDAADTVVVSASPASTEPAPEAAKGSGTLTLDEIRSMQIHGVTPEFVAQIRALGYSRATVHDLVALRIHGVSPENIAGFQKIFGRISLERAVEFAIHGVTPDWIDGLRTAGLRVSPDQAVAMRIHGVTPEFLRSFQDAGFTDLSADRAVALRIHGVDPAFAKEMRSLGFADASLDELTSFRIHGVTPAFVRETTAAGLTGLSADEATSLRIHGVTPEFLRELKTLGVSVGSADDATGLRIHGVSAEFIRSVQAAGYPKPTVDELTSLRIHGVTAEDIRKINRAAGKRLALDDVIDEKVDGLERRSE